MPLKWPWTRKRRNHSVEAKLMNLPPAGVDMSRDRVAIGDLADPTSLLLTLSMRIGSVMLTQDKHTAEWVVHSDSREWRGWTQLDALRNCYIDTLEADPA